MCTMISTLNMPREEWLKLRKTGIGGSDAGAICGLNPYSSPMKVYRDKTSDDLSDQDSETMAAPSSRIKRGYTAPPTSKRHGFPSHASSCAITPHPGLSTFRYSYLYMMPLDYPLGQYAWQRL